MVLKPIHINQNDYPELLRPYLNAPIYDSSCSREATVIYINKDQGYFLKSAEKKSLKKEATLTSYFHQKALAPQVVLYLSEEKDWLLTKKAVGADCTSTQYLENPTKLCDILAQKLLELHSTSFEDCPILNHTKTYLETAKSNYQNQKHNIVLFQDSWRFNNPQEAYNIIKQHSHLLKNDTLLHGDYCLPNIILDNWKFSSFIDLDSGGVGDKHVDILWAIWTLKFNLKTGKYKQRFIDAYGKTLIDEEMLRLVAAIEVFG